MFKKLNSCGYILTFSMTIISCPSFASNWSGTYFAVTRYDSTSQQYTMSTLQIAGSSSPYSVTETVSNSAIFNGITANFTLQDPMFPSTLIGEFASINVKPSLNNLIIEDEMTGNNNEQIITWNTPGNPTGEMPGTIPHYHSAALAQSHTLLGQWQDTNASCVIIFSNLNPIVFLGNSLSGYLNGTPVQLNSNSPWLPTNMADLADNTRFVTANYTLNSITLEAHGYGTSCDGALLSKVLP